MKRSDYLINTICILLSVIVTTRSFSVNSLHYAGCYDPKYSIQQNYNQNMSSVTLAKCLDRCLGVRRWPWPRFIAVTASDNVCYCGNDIADKSAQMNAISCNIPCPDAPLRTCGGDESMSVYEYGRFYDSDDTEDVSFVLGADYGVSLYGYRNDSIFRRLLTTMEETLAVDYHISKNLVYAYSKNKLFKAAVGPETSYGQVIKNMTGCTGFAVDWVRDRIYWADCSTEGEASIKTFGLDGEAEDIEPIITFEVQKKYDPVSQMQIDPYCSVVFWVASGVLQSYDISRERFNPNMTNKDLEEFYVSAIALDLKTRRVYYAGSNSKDKTKTLNSLNYNGGEKVTHFSIPASRGALDVLSISGDKVFWMDRYSYEKETLYQAPVNLTNFEEGKIIKQINKNAWTMKALHPNLQTWPKTEPCLNKGCSPDLNHTTIAGEQTSEKCVNGSLSMDKIRYFGCRDPKRPFQKWFYRSMGSVSLAKCVEFCKTANARFAGVKQSLCHCGREMDEKSVLMNDTCNTLCPDVFFRSCGGDELMSVYSIDSEFEDSIDNERYLFALKKDVKLNNAGLNSTNFTVMTNLSSTFSLDYHLSKKLIFVKSGGRLFKRTIDTQDKRGQLVKNKCGKGVCYGFAVDWVHDRIYMVNCTPHTITVNLTSYTATEVIAFGLNGEDDKTIVSFEEPIAYSSVSNMVIDPYAGVLFWLADSKLQSLETSGECYNEKMSEEFVDALALDLRQRRVYYTGTDGRSTLSLYSVDYAGIENIKHFSISEVVYTPLLSVLNDKVLWFDFANKSMYIYHASLNVTESEEMTLVKPLQMEIGEKIYRGNIKVVHPSLQTRPEDPCLNKSCVHSCIATGVRAGKCKCPPGQIINPDGVSCRDLLVGNVNFLLATDHEVILYQIGDNSTNTTRMARSKWTRSLDYHLSKKLIYVYAQQKLYRAALGHSNCFAPLIVRPGMCTRFAVDWVHDRIYWTKCSMDHQVSIMAMGLDGEAEETIISYQKNFKYLHGLAVDPYSGMIFWSAGGPHSGVLQSIEASGGGYNWNVTNEDIRTFVLDLKLRRIYYPLITEMEKSFTLYSIDYTGAEKKKHFTIAGDKFYTFSDLHLLGILDNKVFWWNKKLEVNVIYEASLNSTGNETVKMIDSPKSEPNDIKLVHPSLQSRPEGDPCLDKGCVHSCISTGMSPSSARCKCPLGQTLDVDGVSCREIETQSLTDKLQYVGCYDARNSFNKEDHYVYYRHIASVNLVKCLAFCGSTRYAAVNVRDNLCYCGEEIAGGSKKMNDSMCNTPCPDDSLRTCGGDELMSVYDLQGKTTP